MRILLLVLANLSTTLCAQNIALRSSGTLLATLSPNIEVSGTLTKKMTVHLPVIYNPWKLGQNSRMQQLTCMPGARYWFEQSYLHWFCSAYAVASKFNVGGFWGHKYRYSGNLYGTGVGFGYSYVLSKQFNLDLEAGAALVWMNAKKSGWEESARLYNRIKGWRVIPSKFDVSIVYFF